MGIAGRLRELTPVQRNTFIASFLGWTLDSFDYFLVPLLATRIAATYHASITTLLFAITVTLMFRPLGALVFGMISDRFGRRAPLMADIILYSAVEFLTAFSPTLGVFFVLRAIYGFAMGGEWGLGAALALESLPTESRGFFSGLLQQGYACGFLLATLADFLLLDHLSWRGMFVIGTAPALLIVFIRAHVPESPAWLAQEARRKLADVQQRGSFAHMLRNLPLLTSLRTSWPMYLYAVVLMTAFNFMSHGTQDLYPTFLTQQRALTLGQLTQVNVIANLGAVAGGMLFGALSQRAGRRRMILIAATVGIIVVPLWAYGATLPLLAAGGFLVQFCVQGAWGVIPIHLNELSPPDARASFPGLTYQLGNFLAAGAGQLESAFAGSSFRLPGGGSDYAQALSVIATSVFVAVGLLTIFGPERKGIAFTHTPEETSA